MASQSAVRHSAATRERCVEAHYLRRTRFERIAQWKLRRRQLGEDGYVEISGRDFARGVRGRRAHKPRIALVMIVTGNPRAARWPGRTHCTMRFSPWRSARWLVRK